MNACLSYSHLRSANARSVLCDMTAWARALSRMVVCSEAIGGRTCVNGGQGVFGENNNTARATHISLRFCGQVPNECVQERPDGAWVMMGKASLLLQVPAEWAVRVKGEGVE